MVVYLHQPGLDEAVDFAREQFLRQPEKSMLILLGDCQIRYSGRAQSRLDWGDRLMVVKQDGTVFIHQPTGREPVNWQPAGARTRFQLKDDLFVAQSVHYKNKEKMVIRFRRIEMMLVAALRDMAELHIVGMEKDLADRIMESPEVIEPGLRLTRREKQTRSGLIDLYGYDADNIPVVIEVKRGQATISAVQQLRMYVTDLKHGNPEARVRGILCTPQIPEMVRRLLEDYGLEWHEYGWQHELELDQQRTLSEYR